jgi:hypothetical protein
MNLRILKKLSKRAAPYLERIGDTREQFKAVKDENLHGLIIKDMTRLERRPSSHGDVIDKESHVATLQPKCRQGTRYPYVSLSYPYAPLKGTIMVGGVSGYEQPEWDEETAWGALSNWVWGHFFEYDPENDIAFYSRTFRTPSEIFAAADELLSQKP